jgi:hypothetical protein
LSETKRYCPYCNEAHIVSPTYDSNGEHVGYFCNRTKIMTEAFTPIWNGQDLAAVAHQYADQAVDIEALRRMDRGRLHALAKRLAYRVMQTEEAKVGRWNFAFLAHWFHVRLTVMYDSLTEGAR